MSRVPGSPFRFGRPDRQVLANDVRRPPLSLRLARGFDWLIARNTADERRQVAVFAVVSLVLVLLIAGVKP